MAEDSEATGRPRLQQSLALYRKYRPATFAEVRGQDHVTEPLRQALRSGRINHAYLFSGPRGCGKTSSARILARSLNCVNGPTPDPCGVCDSCIALAPSGPGSIDVIEIDAASHGGVDDARDLRERAFYAPVGSRYKIYIIDEAHMVSSSGFNALLKLVEEPPAHLKFIFATTEPDKVIATIRSRTHHYPFRLMPPSVMRDLAEEILHSEGVTFDPAVLPLVVRAGAGSARDSLSILDQLLAGSDEGGIRYDRAVSLLGYTDASLLDEIVDAFAAGDGAGVFRAVNRVIEGGHEPRRFGTDMLDRFRDLIVLASVPDAITTGLLDVPPDRAAVLQGQAERHGLAGLTRAAEIVAAGLDQMRGATSPRLLLELMCAQVLLPGAATDERAVLARIERLEAGAPPAPRPGENSGHEERSGPPAPLHPSQVPAAPQPPAAPVPSPSPVPAADRTRPAETERPAGDGRPAAGGRLAGAESPAGEGRPAGTARPFDEPAPAPATVPSPVQPEQVRPGEQARPHPVNAAAATPHQPQQPHPQPQQPHPQPQQPHPQPQQPHAQPQAPHPQPQAPHQPHSQSQQPQQISEAPTVAEAAVPPVPRGPVTAEMVSQAWPGVLEAVKAKRRVAWLIIGNASVVSLSEGQLTLRFPRQGDVKGFQSSHYEDLLKQVLNQMFGINVVVRAMSGSDAPPPAGRPGSGPAPVPATAAPAPFAAAPANPGSAASQPSAGNTAPAGNMAPAENTAPAGSPGLAGDPGLAGTSGLAGNPGSAGNPVSPGSAGSAENGGPAAPAGTPGALGQVAGAVPAGFAPPGADAAGSAPASAASAPLTGPAGGGSGAATRSFGTADLPPPPDDGDFDPDDEDNMSVSTVTELTGMALVQRELGGQIIGEYED